MTNPRISLPRAPGLTDDRQLKRYFDFLSKFGSQSPFEGCHEHHIHPTKMGGPDETINLCYLTPRAHYIAHQILFRAFIKNEKAQRAAWLMSHTQEGVFVSSKMYSFLKENYIFSEETRRKLSKAGKGRTYTEDQKRRISDSNIETYWNTAPEVRVDRIERMRAKKKGSSWTKEQRKAITPSLPRGKDHWRLRGNPLWDRAEEILEIWLSNGKPGYKALCKLLGVPKTKSVMSIVISMI